MEDFKQVLTEHSYSRQEELIFGECDRNENVRMSTLLSKVACFGGYDYDARGITREVLIRMGYAFLLSRVALHIHRRPGYGDILTIQTWENGARGAHMQRVFEMTDQEGRLCVSAKSDWILVHPDTHKIQRPRSFTHETFVPCPREIDCPEPKKSSCPKRDWRTLGPGRSAGPTWTATAICTAAGTATSSGTLCRRICGTERRQRFTSITARKPHLARHWS